MQAAAYWHAELLLGGWGEQTSGASRSTALAEAARLFFQCEAFAFNATEASARAARAQGLIRATHAHAKHPWYLLALHAFSVHLKTAVVASFPSILIKAIKDFSRAATPAVWIDSSSKRPQGYCDQYPSKGSLLACLNHSFGRVCCLIGYPPG